jgi:hypothetical protein
MLLITKERFREPTISVKIKGLVRYATMFMKINDLFRSQASGWNGATDDGRETRAHPEAGLSPLVSRLSTLCFLASDFWLLTSFPALPGQEVSSESVCT